MKFTNTLLGLGVGLFAGSAAALSLGEAHGHVVLGRPIDLVFDIHTDPGMELEVACINASAIAGETPIDSSRFRIAALPVVAGRPPSVRIRSSLAVVEPILTVRLVVGCSGVVARTYDFFVDTPIDASSVTLPLVVAALPAPLAAANGMAVRQDVRAPVVAAPTASVAAAAMERRSAPLAATRPKALPKPPKSTTPPQTSKPPKSSKPAKEPVPRKTVVAGAPVVSAPAAADAQPRSRLTVEPVGDWLAGPASAPGEQRAQATALSQALTTAAEDLQKAQARLQQQQAEINAARASREKMQGMVTDLQQRMERLDSERFSATLVYGLLALLVAAFALLGWLWQRLRGQMTVQRTEPDWNYPAALNTKGFAAAADEATESALMPSVPAFSPRLDKAEGLVPTVVPQAAAASQPVPLELATSMTAAAPLAPFPPLMPPPITIPAVRVLHPEDLFDLQQQAEFFVSVGEHDQAIEVMHQHIDENETASPLMYLELLRLYRSLSRSEDFKQLRARFQQHFNALVPEFVAFQEGGRTLLGYPEIVANIEAVWSDVAVLPLLENCIFRRNGSHSSAVEPFELPAYDDLLLLYAIASTTPASARGAPPPRQRTTPSANPVPLPPLVQERPEQALLSPEPLTVASDDMGMDLEFDLGPFLDANMSVEAGPGLDLDAVQLPANSNLIDYDDFLLSEKAAPKPGTVPPPLDAVAPVLTLDLDLSDPLFFEVTDLPPLTQNDLPALDATPAPAAGQPIGFGAVSDRFEARFELDEDEVKPLK